MRPHVLHWLEGFLRADVANLLAPTWFMCAGLAGLVTLILMLVLARRRGIDSGTIASAVLWTYVAAVSAGIVMPMLIDSVEHLFSTGQLHLRWSGMTSFWGYIAGISAGALVCRRDGLSLARMGDLSVIPLGVALVFARLGCFMAGCDYGKVTSLPWAVRFPAGSPAWRDQVHAGLVPAGRVESLPVHPTQLYEALLGIAIVAIAIYLGRTRRTRNNGQLFVIAAAVYAIGRLVIETLRGDAGRGIYGGLSSGQIFSICVLLAIAARTIVAKRRAVLTVATAAALALVLADVGEADAQPVPQQVDPQDPPAAPTAKPPVSAAADPMPLAPPMDSPQQLPPAMPSPDYAERPQFDIGLLFGAAMPLNRRAMQIPTLAGASLSLAYLPGRFGLWVDYDSYANTDATHGTLLLAGSFTQRLNKRFAIGGRFGVGHTEVNFKDAAFRDVSGTTVRFEAIAEIVLARNWAIWVRPLTIDTLNASDLGGPITTYQFRVGFTFRFGSRRNAVPVQPLPPLEPMPPQPPPPPAFPSLPTDTPETAPAPEDSPPPSADNPAPGPSPTSLSI